MIKNRLTFCLIYIFAFLWTLAGSVPTYIQSSFLEQFVGIKIVGLYITVATFITLLVIFVFPRVIKRFSNYWTTVVLMFLLAMSAWCLSIIQSPWFVLLFFISHYLAFNLIAINIDVFLENISDKRHSGRIRTTFLTVINVAWVISPFIMGELTGNNNYSLVYLATLFVIIPAIVVLLLSKKHLQDHTEYKSRHLHQLLKVFRKNKDLARIFKVSFALRIFYCIMVLYTPLYLHEYIGFSWEQIGLIFTIMLLPFVIFQMPAGTLADRYFGEKEIMVLGLIIMMIATGAIFFISSASFVVWSSILFLTRVGASLVEAMQDVYFFKIVNKRDMDLINLFRDLRPAAWLAGSLLAVVILEFLPFQYIFLAVALILLIAIRPALALKDTK